MTGSRENGNAPAQAHGRRKAGLGKRVAGGAAWLISLRLMLRLLGLANIVVLARLLVPEDFGLVALATMAQGLLVAMAEFRPDLALIRERDVDRRHYDTVWTLTILRGLAIALVLVLSAPWYAGFFSEPRLELILYLLALAALADGLQNIGIVDFFRDLELDRQFRFVLVTRLTAITATWIIALIWRNYWALVAGALLEHIVPALLSYRVHPYRPRLSLAMWKHITGFSMWVMLNNFLTFVNGRSDTFVLGKLTDASVLGNYTMARRIAFLPGSELVAPIRQAVFPGYAKLAGDAEQLKKGFIRVFALVLLVAMPVTVGLGLVVDPFVKVFLGGRWLDVIPVMKVLVICAVLKVSVANTAPALLALGRPNVLSLITFSSTLVLLPLLVWGAREAGVLGAAWAVTASAAVGLALSATWVSRALRVTASELLGASWRPVLAVTAMIGVVLLTDAIWPERAEFGWNLARLATFVVSGALSYLAALVLLWRVTGAPDGAEHDLLQLLPRPIGAALEPFFPRDARNGHAKL